MKKSIRAAQNTHSHHSGQDHDHSHGDDHDHVHSHDALDAEHSHDPSQASRALLDRLIALLIEKSVLTQAELDAQQAVTDQASHRNGAQMVARAWVDSAYRELLLRDGSAAAEQLGFSMAGAPPLGVLENTAEVHHLIVCTLCSCYPRMLLGYPPEWYKSSAYRARAVKEPRGVLAEWNLPIAAQTEIRVVDSTADFRWMVLPSRPAGTEHLDEAALIDLVTRDSLVGADVLTGPDRICHPRPISEAG